MVFWRPTPHLIPSQGISISIAVHAGQSASQHACVSYYGSCPAPRVPLLRGAVGVRNKQNQKEILWRETRCLEGGRASETAYLATTCHRVDWFLPTQQQGLLYANDSAKRGHIPSNQAIPSGDIFMHKRTVHPPTRAISAQPFLSRRPLSTVASTASAPYTSYMSSLAHLR